MILTTKQAAEFLGFSTQHIRRLIKDGVIKAIKHGREHIIHKRNLKGVKRRRALNKKKD